MGPHPADDVLFFEALSASARPLPEIAARAAGVLDGAGALAPDRGGFSARTRALGPDGFAGLVRGASDGRLRNGLWAVFERRDLGLWGDLRVFPDTRLTTSPRFHDVAFRLPLAPLRSDPELRDRAVGLLCDLFVAIDGFWGRADTAAMRRRLLDLRTAAADAGRMWVPRWDDCRFVIYDRWIEDVWWLNLFGPAFVERWGPGVVERLGVRREWLANGGAAIWSSELPADPAAADAIAGYPHKAKFYDVLGPETFIHESLEIPEPGVRVPTLDRHARPTGHPSRTR